MDNSLADPGTDLLEAAAAAQAQGDLEEALRLWSDHRRVHPARASATLEACKALRQAGRVDEAEVLCQAALRDGCDSRLRVLVEGARIAEARGDNAAALDRWQAIAEAFPMHGAGPMGAANLLIRLHRLDEAEALLAACVIRIPEHAGLGRLFAQVAVVRQDWPLALQRWDAVLARHPNDQGAVKGRGATLWQARLDAGGPNEEGEAGLQPDGLVDVGRAADPQAHDLVMRFESLGQNCEFGLVQRRFGAEPLGLLRWTFVEPRTLGRMLETRFAGLGEPDHVSLRRSSWGEWYIEDSVFRLSFHTFQTSDVPDQAAYLKKQAARLRWLRDKLLDDLTEGTKIFVYKPRAGTPDAPMNRIFRALKTFPKARLLCIGLAGQEAAAGTVAPAAGRHAWGYLSVHNPLVRGKWDIPFEEWLSVCRAALGNGDAKESKHKLF
jgi:hypothetical protein